MKKEQDKAKKKRLKEMEEKFKKLQKAENSLNRSLATSANSTPATSPVRPSPKKKKVCRRSPKTRTGKTTRKERTTAGSKGLDQKASQKQRGERVLHTSRLANTSSDVLINKTSDLNSRGDRINEVFELLGKAADLNQNLQVLNPLQNECSQGILPSLSQQCSIYGGANAKREVMNTIGQGEQMHIANSLQSVVQSDHDQQKQLIELLKELKELKIGVKDSPKNKTKTNSDDTDVDSESITEGKKKPVSGKLAKPDDTDIKKPVKYAHEKLDPRHSKDRVFDKLNFQLLVAGELELATREEASKEERDARTRIAKVLCYHKLYLNDEDLCIGYDTTMKKVEHGEEQWSPKLAEELHIFLDYRATVISRERMKEMENKMNDKGKGKKDDKTGTDSKLTDDGNEENSEFKPIFCMDYNKGECSYSKSHTGKWRGKKTTKWHVCRACLKNNELAPHPENDPKCPTKKD